MSVRGKLVVLLLGVPGVALLVLGPRRAQEVPAGHTVIRYWEKWTGLEGRAMQAIVDRFNSSVGAEHGIWVQYCAISNVERRTLIATAGGDPPDVAGLFDHIVPQFADQGALLELDELAREFGIESRDFKPVWWNVGVYRERLYALPSAPYTIALHYNKRLFREAGLDPDQPPRTVAELDDCARRLTRRDDQDRIVQLGFTTAPAMLGWWHWVWPCFFGADLWDGRQFHLNTAAGLAAMDWIAGRRAELGLKDALAFEATAGAIEGPQNPFLSERLAMVFQGPWLAAWVRTYNPELDYGVAAFPCAQGVASRVFASADVFVIPRGSRHPRQAMRFLSYVLRQEVMEELCRLHGKVSPYADPSRRFFEDHPNPHIRVFDDLAHSEHTFGYPKMPTFANASAELLFMHESVLQGVRSPEQAVRATQAKIDSIVNAYQGMADRRRQARGRRGDGGG